LIPLYKKFKKLLHYALLAENVECHRILKGRFLEMSLWGGIWPNIDFLSIKLHYALLAENDECHHILNGRYQEM